MIDTQQAEILHGLVVRALGFDARGNIIAVPAGFDLADVADALAGIEAEKDGESLRPVVVEFLSRLGPDLVAAQIDANGTPSATRLERYIDGAAELLAELGVTSGETPRRMTVQRHGQTLNLPGWLPLEVIDALARIAAALHGGSTSISTATALACEVEFQAAHGRTARAIIDWTAELLGALDPGFDGVVTPLAVEVAVQRVGECDAGLVAMLREELREVYTHSRGEAVDGSRFTCTRCRKQTPAENGGGGDGLDGLCDDCWCAVQPLFGGEQDVAIDAAIRSVELVDSTTAANDAPRSGSLVCMVKSITDAVVIFTSVTGRTMSTSELNVMSLGEETELPGGGASIVRTTAGWELWRTSEVRHG